MKHKIISPLLGTILFAVLVLFTGRVARADSVITNCANESQLTSALALGGTITFNCGTATITLTSYYFIGINTTIDGGSKITLSGGNSTRLFWVNVSKTLTLKNIVLTNGYAGATYGGCIYVNNGTLLVQNSTIQNCSTNNYAGGAIVSPNGNVTLDHVVMKNNSASSGGAVSATGIVNILHSQFLNNTATSVGGALSLAATSVIYQSTFTGNKAVGSSTNGGAIYTSGPLAIHTGTFISNAAGGQGGAIYADNGSTLNLDEASLLTGNTAHEGGGISNHGTLTIANATLSGNNAVYGGGISGTNAMHLTNTTLSGNVASADYGGIALLFANLYLTNSTLSGNSASSVGGIAVSSSNVQLINTLVAKGTSGANCGSAVGGNFNLSDDNSCGFGAGRDNVALHLGPLAYNGSSIQTHLPQPGSPAIDNGTGAGAPANDERFNPRPQNLIVDVGAVEVCAVKPDKPLLLSPPGNTKYKGTQVTLDWEDTACADKYKITIKNAATGAKVQGGSSDTSAFKTKALTKGTSYTWFVQACNTVGCTKSYTWQFTVK